MIVWEVINIVLLFNFVGINTFETDKCEHWELIAVVSNFEKCLEKDSDNEAEADQCTPFEEARDCVDNHLKGCFVEEDIAIITQDTLAGIRNFSASFLLNPDFQQSHGFVFSEADVDVLYSKCENIPDKNYAQNSDNQKYVMLEDGVKTDNNCTKDEIKKVNTEIRQCLKVEVNDARTKIRNLYHPASIQATVCSIMDKTLGKCIQKTFSLCFSEREKAYLKIKIAESLKQLFGAVEDLSDSTEKDISISSCSVFSSSE